MSIEQTIEWVEWVEGDPPNGARGRPSDWTPLLADVQARPGEWAVVFRVSAAEHKTEYLSARLQRAKRKGFDATCRTVDGERRLYVRWPA